MRWSGPIRCIVATCCQAPFCCIAAGFYDGFRRHFLIVEVRADSQTATMHKAHGMERVVLWSAMVSSLRSCFGCSTLLRIVSPTDGFCDECLERSRRCREDDLGGES